MLAVFIVATLVWSIMSAVDRTTQNVDATRNAYAAQLVAYMCVEHMKTNNQAWPSSWAELDDDFKSGYAQSGQKWKWTFAELKQRVGVEWHPDLKQVESNPSSKPIVWILNSPDRECHMSSPNEIISRYLQSANLLTESGIEVR